MTGLPTIAELLPHRPPMVLLDEVLSLDGEEIVCSARVRASSLFLDRGRLPTTVTMEHMAQAIAAHEGARASRRREPIRIGFLISCREMQVHQDFIEVGQVLEIRARCASRAPGLASFGCSASVDGTCIAEAELTVADPAQVKGWAT